MPRPRAFDEDEAMAAMLAVFWRHGFEATTYRMLERATGVRAKGLFNVFGDKDALFLRVLEVYRARAEALIAQAFDPPGLAAVEGLFGHLARPTEDPDDVANAGCLMVNTVFELGRASAPVRAAVDAYRAMWRDAFRAAIEADGVGDAERRAEFLLGLLWGALSQIRLAGRTDAAAPMAAVVVETVRGWRPQPRPQASSCSA